MGTLRSHQARQALVGLLLLVLTLGGLGRGLATATERGDLPVGIPGLALHICHAGAGEGSPPASPAAHDCCDACALSAAALPATPPASIGRRTAFRLASFCGARDRSPHLARLRLPRQSRGPPAA